MAVFIGKILDNIITIVIGCLSVSLYLNKKIPPKFNKYKVLLIVMGIIFIITGVTRIILAYSQNDQLPSRAEILEEIAKKEPGREDFIYTSP